MKKVLIVDDEALVRVTLRSLVLWEKYGMEIAADCNSGYQALEYLAEHSVDLIITDVKMPGISGLEMLKRLQEENTMPVTVILSGYNEFDLVREAFRLGACDYLIKAEMNEQSLEKLLSDIRKKYWENEREDFDNSKKEPESMAFQLPKEGCYGTVVMEIDDFQRQAVRFQADLKAMLEEPMWELVNQIPKVKRNGRRFALHPGHYIFIYAFERGGDYRQEITMLLGRMQSIWKDYMNLQVSMAVCEIREAEKLEQAIEEGEDLLLLAPLAGKMALVREWDKKSIAGRMKNIGEKHEKLLSGLYEMNESESEREKKVFFQSIAQMGLEEAKKEVLSLIALIAFKFREYDDDFFGLFPENVNYYEKVDRLMSVAELERWLNNYLTWIKEYLKLQLNGVQTDMILRAKRFMADNFSNPELSLKSVADYVGLNEKYFTTKFTQKTGSTFRDYLTQLRLGKAQELLKTTDLKVYEICERIGYNNVEHFNRMFKRRTGSSPSSYRSESQNN